jgi:methionyl-tRNA formyltransferase
LTDEGFLVATGDGAVEILKVQPASKKIMSAIAFLQGHSLGGEAMFFGKSKHV